ncbi:MAG: AarF/ABC1/UbiB kinase family protein [bacterium]|nr:AarF/ABC1/UbiB kinase family protein [bacterium]
MPVTSTTGPTLRSSSTWRLMLRSAQLIVGVGSGILMFAKAWWMLRSLPHRERLERAAGRALVRSCSRLGATFIKIGQIASTRGDLLPRGVFEELGALQDRVPPFPYAEAIATIEAEFGKPVEVLFDDFEPLPVAAASVAQVHQARLSGRSHQVAIKILRPDIIQKVHLDRAILLFMGRALERLIPTLRTVSLEEAIRSFCDAVEEQLDLRNEARNNLRFAANFEDDPCVGFPVLHPTLCGARVLTMDFVVGTHENGLVDAEFDIHQLVEAGMRAVCRMIFLHGFVHADLHPGNMLFEPPGQIILLDLGLVGELTDQDRVRTARMLMALATGDGAGVARSFYENAPHHAVRDYATYEREVCELVADITSKGLGQIQVTLEIGRIFDILRRHHIQARSHMTMVNLALMTAEGMGKRLAPELDLSQEALPYLTEALRNARED